MLSSSQVQRIEESLKDGMQVRRFDIPVKSVEYPHDESPVLVFETGVKGAGMAISCDDVEACYILIGRPLHQLQPH